MVCLQESTEEMRSQRVKERNRLYAARTRERKNRLMQDLRQRCQDLELENYELRERVADLESRLASVYDDTGLVWRDSPMFDVPDNCSPQTSDGSGASVRAKIPTPPSAPTSNVQHIHRGHLSNTKATNKLRFTAAAASRRGAPDSQPSPASTFSGGVPDCLPHPPCRGLGNTGHVEQYKWSLSPGTASAVCEANEHTSANVAVPNARPKRGPAAPDAGFVPRSKNGTIQCALHARLGKMLL